MDNSELYRLWNEFLDSWPIERVRNMTLEEYTEAGNQDAFIHWVEFRTKSVATISGTSSFIFGIYSRKDQSTKKNTQQHIYEEQYAWRAAYGETKEDVFKHIKTEIIKVIDAVQSNELHLINDVDLFNTVKWKIAFLYQYRENIKILPTFAEQRLRFLTGVDKKAKDFKIEDAYAQLLEAKGEQELFEYNNELTQKYLEAYPKEKFNTQIAYDYMHERYSTFEKTAEYLFCIENKFGLELALETQDFDKPVPRIFMKCKPPETILDANFEFITKDRPLISSLNSTKTLTEKDEFYLCKIKNLNQLISIFDWWDELEETNEESSNGSKGEVSQMQIKEQSLNRILFGAAGTGKTYNTINQAVSILENKELSEIENLEKETGGRTKIKGLFDNYKNEGRIKFVTFHQSFSYEDFVEGIRAETDDEGQLSYNVKPGVFKEICEDAGFENEAKSSGDLLPTEASINQAIESLIQKAKLEEQTFNTKRGVEFKLTSNASGTLFAQTSKDKTISLSLRDIKNYLKSQSKNIVDNRAYEWAIANSLSSEIKFEETDKQIKPYVLIIDEINRGNISRIFGELITLIEDSKRLGAEEELSVTLPYSKEEFSVPSNVYIIGTMNSSDRSLTGLDIALRRRFTFIEMPPKPELLDDISVDGLNIGELLKVINQRVEVLLDRDHCLGHANFMSLKKENTREHLVVIFKQKIIPQLQEYFFDDWSKINMVLNANGMLKAQTVERSVLFPNVNTESEGVFEDQKTWQIVETAFDSIDSFANIIRH